MGRIATVFGVSVATIAAAAIAFSYNLGFSAGERKGLTQLDKYKAELVEKEKRIQELMAETSDKIVTQYVDRVKVIKEKQIVYVDRIQDSLPVQYNLSNGWVYLHDQAVKGEDADPTRVADAGASTITDAAALETIIGNYVRYEEVSEQLRSLQQWIRDSQKQIEQENKEPTNDR